MTALSVAGAAFKAAGDFFPQSDAGGLLAYLCPACGCREDPPVNPLAAPNYQLIMQSWALGHAQTAHGLTSSDCTVLGIFPFIPAAPTVEPGTHTAVLTWDASFAPDSWIVEVATSPFTSWSMVSGAHGGAPSQPGSTGADVLGPVGGYTTITNLVTGTGYQFRLRAVVASVGTNPGPASATVVPL